MPEEPLRIWVEDKLLRDIQTVLCASIENADECIRRIDSTDSPRVYRVIREMYVADRELAEDCQAALIKLRAYIPDVVAQ